MPPGRKPAAQTRESAETPLTDYEHLRAQNMMKNNQMFQRLELSTLASMINNTSSKSKDDVSQESGSLYDLRIVRALNKRRLARCIDCYKKTSAKGKKSWQGAGLIKQRVRH